MSPALHIGIDDTDSARMGCTTYVAALLVERLSLLGVTFIDYPHLIRLNPNVPWKTRGNGALCLRIQTDRNVMDHIFDTVVETVEEQSDLDWEGTDPGIVFYKGEEIPPELQDFAKRTIRDVVGLDEALELVRRFGAEAIGFKGGRGIVGALAAVGETLDGDHTYEMIAYRTPEMRGKPRRVRPDSVFKMDEETRGLTFSNVDAQKRRILITPRGPDPVLYGIRGESSDAVKRASEILEIDEEVERWVIFRTNQGTDGHLSWVGRIDRVRPFRPVVVRGSVVDKPRVIPLRHVIFTIGDGTASIDCAAYEPTGKFRNVVKKLEIDDVVEVYGGVRPASPSHPQTINLEKIRVLKLAPKTTLRNPTCPFCNKHMKSMGRNKGFRCARCGHEDPGGEKALVYLRRSLSEGLYIPPPRAQRHLTKPLARYGLEKEASLDLESPHPRDFWGVGP
ncbi:MAG: DUF1743 domain-containing protein [Candidatus Bathyarchaeia archaeon]